MTARSKLRGQKKEAASSVCHGPFVPVESFLVARVSIGERSCCGDIDRVACHVTTACSAPKGCIDSHPACYHGHRW